MNSGANSETVMQLPAGRLMPSPNNPRKSMDGKSLAQLIDSIQELGVQVPLLVRRREKRWYVSCGMLGDTSFVRYLAIKNLVGNENLVETFNSSRSAEENRVAAQAAADERNGSADYVIIAGHRRFEAAKKLKLETLPCIVREMSDSEAREIMLVENLQREDLPALEEAE